MNDFSEMLRPSLAKMNVAIFLFVICGYLVWPFLSSLFGGDDILLGFPMPIRRITLSSDGVIPTESFNVLNSAIDFFFWYLIGAGYLWYKFKRDQGLKLE
ncbi:MAG: hypothetical protein ACI9EW_003709 [Cellvibrionaceae bacterium]|jgi:hypothetical protein